MAPEPLPLSEIPTLSLLYKLKKLVPDPEAETADLPAPSATYNVKISVIRHDITLLAIDSIVNAANESLLGGGGVDGAIHRAAGPELLEECETLDGCPTGYAKITDGYELPVKKVIHAVGPRYWASKKQGLAEKLLAGCYQRGLELAVENGLKSIAFSALSTGVYGYPSGEASEVALATVRKFMDDGKGDSLERIIFCNFLEKDEKAYFANIPLVFPPVVPEDKEESTDKSEAETELALKLPDAPTNEPAEEGEPEAKKQKVSAESTADEVTPLSKESPETASEATSKTADTDSKS